jgi:phosphatidylinositol alpha-mannosyltransferase
VRIALVCPYSLSRPGGVQGQVAGLARSLRAKGHEVTVLSPDDDHPIGPVAGQPAGGPAPAVVIGRSTPVRANGSVAPVSVSPLAALRARRYVSRQGFDVVHLHEPLAPTAGYGFLIRPALPVVATFHRSGGSAWYRALGPLTRMIGKRLAARVAVSEAARETITPAMGECEVLFNGLELDRFTRADPVPTDRPTVLFLGRHEARKGLAVLLEAFARVRSEATLWVGGDGPATAALRARHPQSDRVRWLGLLSETEVASHLAGAHILCAPSLYGESFGMVLLESMAARCAVVASDIPGYRAAAAGHASLVAPGDAGALAVALEEAIADADSGRGRSSPASLDAAVATARACSMERLADRYLEIYRRVTAARSAGG